MPKTKQDLSEILQVRVSAEGKQAIEQAADAEHTTIAEFARRALYRAAKYGRNGGTAR
jgi:uncharacterized protein (DUF1778 family)